MAIEASSSNYRKKTIILAIMFVVGFAAWFTYDGYFNDGYISEHTDEQGNIDSDLVFNQKAPAYLAGGAILLIVYFLVISRKKLVADENCLIIDNNKKIPYDSIEKIDKTYFKSKGYFAITYTDNQNKIDRKFSDKTYDNLSAVLDELVTKIS